MLKVGTPIDVVGYGVQFKEEMTGPPRCRWNWTGQARDVCHVLPAVLPSARQARPQ